MRVERPCEAAIKRRVRVRVAVPPKDVALDRRCAHVRAAWTCRKQRRRSPAWLKTSSIKVLDPSHHLGGLCEHGDNIKVDITEGFPLSISLRRSGLLVAKKAVLPKRRHGTTLFAVDILLLDRCAREGRFGAGQVRSNMYFKPLDIDVDIPPALIRTDMLRRSLSPI